MRNWLAVIALGLVSTAALLVQMTISLPSHLIVYRQLHDFGHFPLYGAVTLLVFAVLGRVVTDWKPRFVFRAFWAFVIAGILGVVAELLQITGPRDADPGDVLRNMAGSVVALALLWLWRRRRTARTGRLAAVAAGVLLLTLLSAWPVLTAGWAKIQQHNSFPVLADFEGGWQRALIGRDSASLAIVPAPDGWEQANGQVGRVQFLTNGFSGISLLEPVPDWSLYRWLAFDLFAPDSLPGGLTVRIDDAAHDGAYTDRYNGNHSAPPGASSIRIDLQLVERGPVNRRMDMQKIRLVMLFGYGVRDQILFIDNIRLERDIPVNYE